MSEGTVYAISLPGHRKIGVDIGSICWGSCGKGAIGAINLGDWGEAIPCVHPSGECPNFDKEQSRPCGTVDFNGKEWDVVIRRLRAAPGATNG